MTFEFQEKKLIIKLSLNGSRPIEGVILVAHKAKTKEIVISKNSIGFFKAYMELQETLEGILQPEESQIFFKKFLRLKP